MTTRSLCLLAASQMLTTAVNAATVSPNTGSLGSAANASNADTVSFVTGAVAAGGDQAAFYDESAGTSTSLAWQSAINPSAVTPFTIEFWANPTETDNDDAPVSNRIGTGNRSGWVFFQRDALTGWNFRMYNGIGSALGWDLTGGTAALNTWNHVVATWDGSAALLYVNGALADSVNASGLNGVYNASTTANFLLATSDTSSLYKGALDETAFYTTALSSSQIADHYAAASSAVPGEYHDLVRSHGALLQLSNNAVPEPSALAFLGLGSLALLRTRRR